MEKNKYTVIWFDDKCKDNSHKNFIRRAAKKNIKLVGFENAIEGINELKSNEANINYDAILLDGLFYLNKEDDGDNVQEKALQTVLYALEGMNERLTPFVLSGQTTFVEVENSIIKNYDRIKRVYDKNSENDLSELWEDIITAANNKKETQIRHRYQQVFEVFTEKYIGNSASKHLIEILLSIENPTDKFDDEKHFNGIRKIVEYVFRASKKIGLLHDKCIPDGIVNLTWSSMFLAGHEVIIKPTSIKISSLKAQFPSILANNIKNLLDITSAASHTEGQEKENGKVNFTAYKNQINSKYLLYSLAFQVMDLILWFKKTADENPSLEINKELWCEISSDVDKNDSNEDNFPQGKVMKADNKEFAFFKPDDGTDNVYIPKHLVEKYSLQDEMPVAIEIEDYIDMTSGGKKRRAIKVNIIK